MKGDSENAGSSGTPRLHALPFQNAESAAGHFGTHKSIGSALPSGLSLASSAAPSIEFDVLSGKPSGGFERSMDVWSERAVLEDGLEMAQAGLRARNLEPDVFQGAEAECTRELGNRARREVASERVCMLIGEAETQRGIFRTPPFVLDHAPSARCPRGGRRRKAATDSAPCRARVPIRRGDATTSGCQCGSGGLTRRVRAPESVAPTSAARALDDPRRSRGGLRGGPRGRRSAAVVFCGRDRVAARSRWPPSPRAPSRARTRRARSSGIGARRRRGRHRPGSTARRPRPMVACAIETAGALSPGIPFER
jgi:hypothetical protein